MWRDGAIGIDDDNDHASQGSIDLNGQGDYSDDDVDDGGDDSDVSNSVGQPLLTYVGSSNFSERSWSRDFELGFLIHTTDRRLQNVVTEEYRLIMRHCTSHHRIDNTSYDDDDDDASQRRNGSIDSRGDTSAGRTESNYRYVLRSMRLIPPPSQQKSSSPVPEHGQWKQRMLHSMSRVLRSFL